MHNQELTVLLRQALFGDSTESKGALKLLVKNKYSVSEPNAKAILRELEKVGSIETCPNPDAFMRLLNLAIFARASSGYELFYERQIVAGLLHMSGQVRENARKTVMNLPFVYGYEESGKTKFVRMLHKVETLIKSNEPSDPPISLSQATPSVYKTLCLTWHDMMAMFELGIELNYFERMVDFDIPPYLSDEEEAAPEEAEFSMRDWRECIDNYYKVRDYAVVLRMLKDREKSSLEMLRWALGNVDALYAYDRIVRLAKSDESHLLTRELSDIMLRKADVLRPEAVTDAFLLDHNKIARAIQSIDNNMVLLSESGLAFSRVLVILAEDSSYDLKPKPILLDEVLHGFGAAHESLNKLVLVAQEQIDQVHAMYLRYEMEATKPDVTEYLQVAQYILDWLLQMDYKLFTKKSAEQLAAVAWSIMSHANEYGGFLTESEIAAFGGWAGSSGLSSFRSRIQYMLTTNMLDLDILRISEGIDDDDFTA